MCQDRILSSQCSDDSVSLEHMLATNHTPSIDVEADSGQSLDLQLCWLKEVLCICDKYKNTVCLSISTPFGMGWGGVGVY